MTTPKPKQPVDPPGGVATDAGRRKADRRVTAGAPPEGVERRAAERRGSGASTDAPPPPASSAGDPLEDLDLSPREITRRAFETVSNALTAIPETVAAVVGKGGEKKEPPAPPVPRQASSLLRAFGWQDPDA